MCISSGCNIGLNKKVCLENISIEKDKKYAIIHSMFFSAFCFRSNRFCYKIYVSVYTQYIFLFTLTKGAKKILN